MFLVYPILLINLALSRWARQEYWSGLLFPSPEDLPNAGVKPGSCDPTDCSMPGFPVLHYLSEFGHTHVHWVGDAIQCLIPWSPFSSCPQFVQNQGFFKWVSSSHQVAYIWGWPSSQLIWRPRNEWILQAFITALDGLPSNAIKISISYKGNRRESRKLKYLHSNWKTVLSSMFME